jgi:hypothetical protein
VAHHLGTYMMMMMMMMVVVVVVVMENDGYIIQGSKI